MKTATAIFLSLIVGIAVGYYGPSISSLMPVEEPEMSEHDHDGHTHPELVVMPEDGSAPTVDFELLEDAAGGWNLHIQTTNYTFAPENVNGENMAGEGHAHIYINNVKLARVYGPWFHIGSLPSGDTEIVVTLNANDHSEMSVGGEIIYKSKTLQVP